MLRRGSSKKQRQALSRSKSTSSILPNPIHELHSSPVSAERDAQIAARISYKRSLAATASEGMVASCYDFRVIDTPPGSRGMAAYGIEQHGEAASLPGDMSSAPTLCRQRSIRFAGPNAIPRRNPRHRARDNRTVTSSATMPPFAPSSEYAQGTTSNDSSGNTLATLEAPSRLHARENSYTVGDDAAFTVATRRGIRKSRSLFTSSDPPRHADCYDDTELRSRGPTPLPGALPLYKENEPPERLRPSELRACRSTSFLRHHREQTGSSTGSRLENDLAIRTAHERFREQVEHQSHPGRRFPVFARPATNRRTDSSTGLRKSMRNSSNNSTSLSSSISGDAIGVSNHGSLRKHARRVSMSIRARLNGLFGRQTESDDVSNDILAVVPVKDEIVEHHSRASTEGSPVGAPPRRPSLLSSLASAPRWYDADSRAGTLDKGGGDTNIDDKSRVTSWTDSVTNTTASQAGVEWEPQPLQSIDEDKVKSPSESLPPAGQPINVHGEFKIDSQRVYSALMKRVSRNRQKDCSQEGPSSLKPTQNERSILQCASVRAVDGREWARPTIRHVKSEGNVYSGEDLNLESTSPNPAEAVPNDSGSIQHSLRSRGESPNPWTGERGVASPGETTAATRTPDRPNKHLVQRSSAFFASPTSHLFRTTSPYRRALRENMRTAQHATEGDAVGNMGTGYLGSLSALSLPTRRSSPGLSDGLGTAIYDDSVYSSPRRGECGHSPSGTESAKLGPPQATLGAPTSMEQIHEAREDPPTSGGSRASSVEWKVQLSSHVAEAETTRGIDTAWGSPVPAPRRGHVREMAEIESATEAATPSPKSKSSSINDGPLKEVAGTNSQHPRGPRLGCSTPGSENKAPLRNEDGSSNSSPYTTPSKRALNTIWGTNKMKMEHGESSPWPSQHGRPFRVTPGSSSTTTEERMRRRQAYSRISRASESPAKSIYGLARAVEKQFGKAETTIAAGNPGDQASVSSSQDPPKWNRSPFDDPGDSKEEWMQALGGSTMVERFLNSRQTATSRCDQGTSPSAFV